MKVEIEYTIKEVTRFVIYKTARGEGAGGDWWATDMAGACGEFGRRRDAESVRDALERDAERKVRGAL